MPQDPYVAAWAQARRARSSALWFAVLWPSCFFVSTCALNVIDLRIAWGFWDSLLSLAVAGWAVRLLGMPPFPCPACNHRFRSRWNPWSRRCQRCGIRFGTPKVA
jgi:hypothetical protein